MAVRSVVLGVLRLFSVKIRDHRTGEVICRALLIPWRGRLLVIDAKGVLVPEFLPQQRLTYWKQELGFTRHPPPDFPSLISPAAQSQPKPATAPHENADLPADAPAPRGDGEAGGDLDAGGPGR